MTRNELIAGMINKKMYENHNAHTNSYDPVKTIKTFTEAEVHYVLDEANGLVEFAYWKPLHDAAQDLVNEILLGELGDSNSDR